jgi:hypothetical protein
MTVDIVIKQEEEEEGPLGKILKIGKMTKTRESSWNDSVLYSKFKLQSSN